MSGRRTRSEPAHSVADTLPMDGRLWTQRQAALYLGVTTRYLRSASCPKLLLPGNGKRRIPLVRYKPDEVKAWAEAWGATSTIRRMA